MKARCDNPDNPGYKWYGARGIGYDPRWGDFQTFRADMGKRPSGRSLDRINVNFGYSKDNCRWATDSEQSRNKRNNVVLTYNGKTMVLEDWARSIGIYQSVLSRRLKRGWPLERALKR